MSLLLLLRDLFLDQSFPVSFYIYALLPLVLWREIAFKYKYWMNLLKYVKNSLLTNVLKLVLLFIGIEFLLLSFFYRQILTVMLIIHSIVLVFMLKSNNNAYKWLIIPSPILLSIFPSLPPISGSVNVNLV